MGKSFEVKPIKEGGKNPNWQFQSTTTSKYFNQTAQQFITAPTSPNPYVTHTLNNMNLVKTINEEKKDWMKKYHKIIQEIKRMVNVQMQLQNIVKLVEEANIQIAEIESKIL